MTSFLRKMYRQLGLNGLRSKRINALIAKMRKIKNGSLKMSLTLSKFVLSEPISIQCIPWFLKRLGDLQASVFLKISTALFKLQLKQGTHLNY